MDALLFTWSGSFREEYKDREEEITHLVSFVHDRFDIAVGVLADESRDAVEADLAGIDLDFAVGDVENIIDVVSALTRKYDRVFFVSDVRAELAAVNQTGAITFGVNSARQTAEKIGGVGPNYIVDSMDDVEQILVLEHL